MHHAARLIVGQFLLLAVVQERQLIVTEPEEMQQRRLEIVVADLVNHRAMAEVTGLAIGGPGANPATGKPQAEPFAIVVAPPVRGIAFTDR